jgi:hypothetical protein
MDDMRLFCPVCEVHEVVEEGEWCKFCALPMAEDSEDDKAVELGESFNRSLSERMEEGWRMMAGD